MPKIVCVNCEVEFKVHKNDALVIEHALFGPYKVWNADIWRCPKCGQEVVAGFAQLPLRSDHYAPDFSAWLERIKGAYLQTNRRVIDDFEYIP